MYVITVDFTIKPEHVDEFRREMILQGQNSLRDEKGCLIFEVCFAPDNPRKCFLYERYEDKPAFEHHLTTTHFKHFDATISDWIESKTVSNWEFAAP